MHIRSLLLLILSAPFLHGESVTVEKTEYLYTLKYKEGKNAPFEVRVSLPETYSWPGDNRQIIEVYKDNKKISSRKSVGEEPRAKDVWGAVDVRTDRHDKVTNAEFIYILCEHRRRRAKAIYSYRITDDLKVEDSGIVFTRDELEKEAEQAGGANPEQLR